MQPKEYVILLPLTFNDGTPVPPECIRETKEELIEYFGGATFDPGTITGYWIQDQLQYSDELIRVRVSGVDPQPDDAFIRQYKDVLKARFQQEEIYIIAYLIERF